MKWKIIQDISTKINILLVNKDMEKCSASLESTAKLINERE